MTISLRTPLASTVLLSLVACSGGSSGGGDDSTAPPPEPGPASTASADLLDFVMDGGTEVYNYETDRNGMTRLQRSGSVDGDDVLVTVDTFEDGTSGLIQYARDGEVTLYTLDDTLAASTVTPDGHYVGAMDVTYSVDGGSTWQVGSGDASVTMDTEEGLAMFGSLVSAENSSLEYYSTAELVDGTFSDSEASVNYRDAEGAFVDQYTGEIVGMVVDTGNGTGVVGLVGGDDGVFQATGGFTMTPFEDD